MAACRKMQRVSRAAISTVPSLSLSCRWQARSIQASGISGETTEWAGFKQWRTQGVDERRGLGSTGISSSTRPPWEACVEDAQLPVGLAASPLAAQAAHVLQTPCPKAKCKLTHRIFQNFETSLPPIGDAQPPTRALLLASKAIHIV